MFSPNELPPVRLGCVKYLNARPLIHSWPNEVVFDHPAVLCRQLAAGELDVALVSSYEFLRDPIYSIVDGVCIASDGEVYSVFLAQRDSPNELRKIVVDPASATSVQLLGILFPDAKLVRPEESAPDEARLLIGDQAIDFREKADTSWQFLDLGAEWKKRFALPFVYALWLIRPNYSAKEIIAEKLRVLAENNLTHLETVIATLAPNERAFCRTYYHNHLRFSLGEAEKQGLQKFGELCAKPCPLRLV